MEEQQREKIRQIALDQLQKGKSPEDIIKMAVAAGTPKEVILNELGTIQAGGGNFAFLPLLGDFLGIGKKQEKKVSKTTQKDEFWDPVGEVVTSGRFRISSEKIRKKHEEYKQNPNIPRRNLFLFSLPGIITILLVIVFPGIIETLAGISEDGDGVMLLLVPFLPIFWYWRMIHKLQRDLVKMIIADDRGWMYSPDERRNRWMNLSKAYPEIFRKGNKDQNFQDEFWGTFEGKRQTVHFWSGIFEYTTESGSGKNRRKVTKRKTAVALRLNKKLKSDFRLEPNGFGASIKNFFRGDKNIRTESSEFNKYFSVYYNGKKMQKQLEIVKTLSPSVQVRILEMTKKEGKFALQFRGETVIFVLNGKLLQKMKTNFFFKGVQLDPRDQKAIEDRLNTMLDISSDIVPFLD
jgi:hypothetical protein